MKKLIIIVFINLFILNGCGFKKVNDKSSSAYFLNNINVNGNNVLSYDIISSLKLYSSKNEDNKINIDLNISQNKKVKEEDLSRKVTRYILEINADAKINFINRGKTINKTFKDFAEYEVSDNYSKTLNNEKKALQLSASRLADKITIFVKLNNKKNDN